MSIHRFIEHPKQIPLTLTPIAPPPRSETVHELGVRLRYSEPFDSGQWLAIYPECSSLYRGGTEKCFSGQVLWCDQVSGGYELGVAFASRQAAFVGRMLEQCCQIECYKNEQEQALRSLSMEQAAAEWIARHAAEFPELTD